MSLRLTDRTAVARLWLGRKLMGDYLTGLESDYWTQHLTLQATEARLDFESKERARSEEAMNDLAMALACAERVAGIDAMKYLQDERHPSQGGEK